MLRRSSVPLLGFALVATASACVSPGDGPSPPGDSMYFPVGLAVSPGGHTLYVANSDFDLQYNGGTIQALDLDRLRALVPEVWNVDPKNPGAVCGEPGLNSQRLLHPGLCAAIDLNNPPDGQGSLVSASVQIGAFATDLLVVPHPDEGQGARLFVPVRGDPSVTWLEIDDDRLEKPTSPSTLYCGQTNSSPRCDSLHRAGEDPKTNIREAVLPPEPYGIAADETGEAIVVTHQTSGAVSLLVNHWDREPTLQFVSREFPAGGVGVAALPVPRYASVENLPYQPGFLVTFRAAAEVDLVRYYRDDGASPARPFVTRSGAVGITVNSSGVDSRGIAIDASKRKTCEEGCFDQTCASKCQDSAFADRQRCENACADAYCLQTCAAIPATVYIANRTPPSLLIGETRANVSPTGSDDLITIYDSVPLTFGASRVVIGNIIDKNGSPQPRVFASCFDARYIFIYDPVGRRVDGHVRTGRGPHAMVLDAPDPEPPFPHPFLYVAHFTDSYIGVVDLDQRNEMTYGTIIASVGIPAPPRESK